MSKKDQNIYKVYAHLTPGEQQEIKDFIMEIRILNGVIIPKSVTLGAILLAAIRDPGTKQKAQKCLKDKLNG